MATMRAHRKKLGICFKCGDSWSHGHKCPQHIPQHVLEEVLDALEPHDSDSDSPADTVVDSDSPVLAIDSKTGISTQTRKTMKLLSILARSRF